MAGSRQQCGSCWRILLADAALLLLLADAAVAAEPCAPAVARIVSLQGTVEVRRPEADWVRAILDEPLCVGDMVRVGPLSRAALAFADASILRLDQRTTLHLRSAAPREPSLLSLLLGTVYFFSREPRTLTIETPFVNAGAEGTEFLVRVMEDRAQIIMFEGLVRAENPDGSLLLAAGEAAVAEAGEAPRPELVVRPRDAVAWALYYPPILAALAGRDVPSEALPRGLRRAAERAAADDYEGALAALGEVPEAARDVRYWALRAGVLLNVGRVEEAEAAIARALALDPDAGEALAQRAIIGVARHQEEAALADARRAVELAPDSPAAQIALSYALQANFALGDARLVLAEAAERFPEDPLVFARLAELELSLGELDRALEAAERAVALAPGLARTQMVLGFAELARIETDDARAAFAHAIELESANPLSRLGLGLAVIREGELAEGRREIEIAAGLDPNDSLIRSYLGKAYFEERRDDLAGEQLAIAKQLDPNDPTPWFYDAIRKQSENRPVEALQDLQTSIRLNDNRAVYRSRLLLDEDLAARGTSLARIYDDLGFDQLALVEASKSLSTDPANWSAHRFLSDTYARLPRHEIARASELLQAQLLQPININPVQPSAPFTDLNIISGVGPAEGAFNEFHPLFERNQLRVTGTGLVGDGDGNEDTFGNEIVASTIWDRYSLSAGQFHFQTNGFRPNNQQDTDIYNLFGQVAASPDLSLQVEYRRRDTEQGDVVLNFDPDLFDPTARKAIRHDTARVGGRLQAGEVGSVQVSAIYTERKDEDSLGVLSVDDEQEGYAVEANHVLGAEQLSFVTGAGFYQLSQDLTATTPVGTFPSDRQIDQGNAYTYSWVRLPRSVVWTIALSFDAFEEEDFERNDFNPKIGIEWQVHPKVRLRAAAIRTLARVRALNQTLEPTTIAGFNQFFDDFSGTSAWQYAGAIDFTLGRTAFAGFSYSHRDLNGPVFIFPDEDVVTINNKENIVEAYAYWTPSNRWALRSEVQYEHFEQSAVEGTDIPFRKVTTWSLPVAATYFDPSGFFGELTGTWVHQEARNSGAFPQGSDSFVVFDAALGYRLPGRRGIISLEGRNLLDSEFRFQDVNFKTDQTLNPRFTPDRILLARATLYF